MSALFAAADLPLSPGAPGSYLVLARKYRSQTFADLVGQEALVTTLTNAITTGRLHHAYLLTGIRGVGKTSTARILAKALNCPGGPSATWDEQDPIIQAITQGHHPDVLEYDAASHTGKDDVIDLFQGVNYRPVQGQYKVYIIDEVHMLSKQAFNALLKTLEEPPAYVKFIFATTEIEKVPITVLSRCMRFDLKRIPAQLLEQHFAAILQQENLQAEPAALQLIARAADGSVRDGLSLLDQAIAQAGGSVVTTATVTTMLGLADRARVYQLLGHLTQGEAAPLLTLFDEMYALGQDPLLLLVDLLTTIHLLTRLKLIPTLATAPSLTELERTHAVPLANQLTLGNINRLYQVLLHALGEAKTAERPHEAVAMALLRASHLANLPPVDALLQQLQKLNPQLATPAVAPGTEAASPVAMAAATATPGGGKPQPTPMA